MLVKDIKIKTSILFSLLTPTTPRQTVAKQCAAENISGFFAAPCI